MKTILVVEDEMKIARLVRDYLEHAGFDVVVAGDGEAAIASARGRRPDLVVLDLGLPAGDGFVVMERMRSIPDLEMTPIVVITARDTREGERAVEAGARSFLQKPFNADELVAEIRATLGAS